MNPDRKIIQELLSYAGIAINGKRSWDIQLYNKKFYRRVFRDKSLGLGEAYIDRWWDCEKIDEFIYRLVKADLESKIKTSIKILIPLLIAALFNLQSKKRAL